LRGYQEELICGKLYGELEKGSRKIVVCSATGSGKTVMFCRVICDAVAEGCPVIVVVHLEQLIGQTVEKLVLSGINEDMIGLIAGGRKEHLNRPIQVASAQSLARRSHWRDRFTTGICLLDEAHLTGWRKVVEEHFFNPNEFDGVIIGWSATPVRLKRTEGFDRFDVLLEAPDPQALTDMGFLAPMRYFAFPKDQRPDLTQVHLQGGDYKPSELETAVNNEQLVNHAVVQWKKHAEGRPTLAFTVSVKHAQALAEAFTRHGIAARCITGETPPEERKELFFQLQTGAIKALCSIDVLSIGADLPYASALLVLRPTKSLGVWLQIIGRGARICPESGKADCIVLDATGVNTAKHGFLTTPRTWSLDPGADPTGGEAPVRECGSCGAIVHASLPECPECGAVFPRQEKRAVRTDDMKEVTPTSRLTAPHKRMVALIRQAHRSGYNPAWASMRFSEEHGYEAPSEFWLHALFPEVNDAAIHRYTAYLAKLGQLKDKPAFSWGLNYLIKEFGSVAVQARLAVIREVWAAAREEESLVLQSLQAPV